MVDVPMVVVMMMVRGCESSLIRLGMTLQVTFNIRKKKKKKGRRISWDSMLMQ
jgi:hypothetical protein